MKIGVYLDGEKQDHGVVGDGSEVDDDVAGHGDDGDGPVLGLQEPVERVTPGQVEHQVVAAEVEPGADPDDASV